MSTKPEITFMEPVKKSSLPKKGKNAPGKTRRRGRRQGKAQERSLFLGPPSRYEAPLTKEQEVQLRRCARVLMEPGKGILSADDSIRQLDDRLRSINISPSYQARHRYHDILLGAGEGLVHYMSGILMKEESLVPGRKIQNTLKDVGILLGIRADKGTVRIPGDVVEYSSAGICDLHNSLKRFKDIGATFALWRCVYRIAEVTPTQMALDINSKSMGHFAASSQKAGLVPIVSPEMLCLGDHNAEAMQQILRDILSELVKAMHDYHVYPEAVLIRLNAAVPGPLCRGTYDLTEVALRTMQVINTTLPPAFGGVLLARSQTLVTSINIINEMTTARIKKVHPMSFCYSHVIQEGVVEMWEGCDSNLSKAQDELVRRAELCSLGSLGQYPQFNGSVFVSNVSRY